MTCFNEPSPPGTQRCGFAVRGFVCAALLAMAIGAPSAAAQDNWSTGVEVQKSPAAKAPNTTVIERADGVEPTITLVALLTADGQQIDQGLVWRIFQNPVTPEGKARLVAENREASPSLKLAPGDYTINASFGRAHLTRHVTVTSGKPSTEKFVLNAGGLRLNALVGDKPAPKGTVTYTILSDDRDQFNNRTSVMTGAKPDLIIRLNAGIYHIISTYGDANARIEADVTVEAGKLTEATVTHSAGRATFRLVDREGGEALPDTHWTILTAGGEVVKESVGALPMHTLAPGAYAVKARWSGLTYSGKFEVKDGETATVEVLKNGSGSSGEEIQTEPENGDLSVDLAPSLDIKNP